MDITTVGLDLAKSLQSESHPWVRIAWQSAAANIGSKTVMRERYGTFEERMVLSCFGHICRGRSQAMRQRLTTGLLGVLALTSICISGEAAAGDEGIAHKSSAADFGAPDPPSLATAPAEYRIGPMDKIAVSVLQLPDLPKEEQVDAVGNINMPLIGSVHAQGLTARELEGALKQKFGEKYLQAPEVQVMVTDAVGDRVTVDGAVLQPGVYPLNGNRSLLQALALAHGLDAKAASNKVAVFRTIKGQRMAAAFDVKKIRKGEQPDPQVYGNDVVVAEGSGTKSVWSTVLQSIPAIALFSAV